MDIFSQEWLIFKKEIKKFKNIIANFIKFGKLSLII